MSRDIQLIALMSFLVTGADLESSKLTFVCLSGSSLVRIEVTGLDQNFSAVDAGVPVVLRGLCFRDVGYGLQATFGSRGSFVVEDPCNLAEKWASVELLENLPLRLACGAAAQAISVSVLVVCCIFVYFEVSFVLAVLLGWFACRRVALLGVIFILVFFLVVVFKVVLLICVGEQSRSLLVRRVTSSCPMSRCKAFLSSMVRATIPRVGSALGMEADCAFASLTRTAAVR